jgi:transposase
VVRRHELSEAEWAGIAPLLPPRETKGTYYRDHILRALQRDLDAAGQIERRAHLHGRERAFDRAPRSSPLRPTGPR